MIELLLAMAGAAAAYASLRAVRWQADLMATGRRRFSFLLFLNAVRAGAVILLMFLAVMIGGSSGVIACVGAFLAVRFVGVARHAVARRDQ